MRCRAKDRSGWHKGAWQAAPPNFFFSVAAAIKLRCRQTRGIAPKLPLPYGAFANPRRRSLVKVLHIDSSALGAYSASRQLSAAAVQTLRDAEPDLTVTYRDFASTPPAHLSSELLPDDLPRPSRSWSRH
jgi:hypothetical protein